MTRTWIANRSDRRHLRSGQLRRPPAGQDQGTGSGGARVDLAHVAPELSRSSPISPTPGQNKNADVDAIRLDVDYFKGRGIQLSAFPAEEEPNGLVMIVVTSGLYVKLEDASGRNRSDVEAWESLVRNQRLAGAGSGLGCRHAALCASTA